MNIIKKIFNLQLDTNQKYIFTCLFIKGLLITYTSPQLTKVIISSLPAEWLAFESLFGSISGLIIGMLWKDNIRKGALNHFTAFALSESICGFLLSMYLCFIHWNVWVFAITSLIYTSLISTFVGKCIMSFKTKLWKDSEREIYDNNLSIVSGIVCIIGFSLALIAMPSLNVSLFLWGMCCIIDDIGWIYVYIKNRTSLKEE